MKQLLIVFLLILFSVSVFGQADSGASQNQKSVMTSIDGQTFGPAELNGKVVVLNFWYTSCPPCLKEIPELNDLVREYSDKDVVFLALATDDADSIKEFLVDHPFEYEIVPSATLLMFRFLKPDKNGNMETQFPTHIVVDREGNRTVYETGLKGINVVKNELKKQFEMKVDSASKTAAN